MRDKTDKMEQDENSEEAVTAWADYGSDDYHYATDRWDDTSTWWDDTWWDDVLVMPTLSPPPRPPFPPIPRPFPTDTEDNEQKLVDIGLLF